ncbi:MAG: DUF4350 domain-containing protein [Pyrinomonadaceae bacterium]|nr:DUF4350 domain-containing protein [Pyrinomonadaceae bacterium]
MPRHLALIVTVIVVVGLLVALNGASYVGTQDKKIDTELKPNRSTFNAGATGTRALYDFLQESGYKVMRWREPPVALLSSGATRPQVFVIVGDVKVDFEAEEAQGLMKWVEEGGRLVVVDRRPSELLPIGEQQGWRILTSSPRDSVADAKADDAEAMTAGVAPVAPTQPTNLTRNVERVAPSRYSSSFIIKFVEKEEDAEATGEDDAEQRKVKESIEEHEATNDSIPQQTTAEEDTPPPPPAPREDAPPSRDVSNVSSPAPVEHLEKAILIDYAYGAGRVVLLGDPFIVANTGISRADNLQLALNLVDGRENLVAFDEYHQGYGRTRNELFAYFAGTPVLWMFAQGLLIALVVVWTRGRRFARPLPLPQTNRASKLEFIRSMAELQGRARAYDLAVENIYTRTRRALARFGGVAADASRGQIAESVAARSGADRRKLEDLMRECEEAVSGNKISAQTALRLTAQLREVEGQLGLRLRARELRQAGKH